MADKASVALHFTTEASPHMLHWQRRCQPPPPFPLFSSPTHHPWLKECSGKRGTRDRRSEALIRNRLCVVLLVSHLLCSPHQEWSGLWWISTKRFETHKERQFSQVCYLKPGNLGIQFSPRGSLWCLSVSLAGGPYIGIKRLSGPSYQWVTIS